MKGYVILSDWCKEQKFEQSLVLRLLNERNVDVSKMGGNILVNTTELNSALVILIQLRRDSRRLKIENKKKKSAELKRIQNIVQNKFGAQNQEDLSLLERFADFIMIDAGESYRSRYPIDFIRDKLTAGPTDSAISPSSSSDRATTSSEPFRFLGPFAPREVDSSSEI